MTAKKVNIYKHFETPKEPGSHYRLLCLTGENKGNAYFLVDSRIILGRSEKADITLKDLKASREHAEITKVDGSFIVTDLGSQNGIMVNDLKVKQHTLKNGDKLIIGSTVFKFGIVNIEEIKVLKKEAAPAKKNSSEKEKKKIKPLHIVIGGILVLLLTLDDEKPSPQNEKTKSGSYKLKEVSNEFEDALRKRKYSQDKDLQDKLKVIFQRGLREFREENYFRAIKEFNLALVLSPNDGQAQFYLQKTKDALDKKIKSFEVNAKRDEDSLHFSKAIVSYCSIVRLLHNYPEDERYKDALKSLKALEEKLGMEENEISCVQK